MVLILGDDDVARLAPMDEAIDVVEGAFRQQGLGSIRMPPRIHLSFGDAPGYLRLMPAAMPEIGYAGMKTYTPTRRASFRFTVLLYDIKTGELLSIMNANRLGQIRTGAASGVATKFLARSDSEVVGILGTGFQAESQLEAICMVRKIKAFKAYSPNQEHRQTFCDKMAETLGVEGIVADSPEEVVKDADIAITATTSREPVLEGGWLEKGVHVNAIGANFPAHREIDDAVVSTAKIVVDDLEQALLEAGDIIIPMKKRIISQNQIHAELGEIVVGKKTGRTSHEEITLFKSLGIAIEDVALASRVYEKAVKEGIGREIAL